MTWLSFCVRRPGPSWKTGYATGDRTLAQIEGVVDHSMEGSLVSAYGVLDGPRQSSWTFSLPKIGEPIQHYSLKKIPWHCGLPGDRKQDTSLIGNLTLVGKEHEGVAGEPWTENQLFWSAKIDFALRALCPQYGKNPPTLHVNTFWHTWLSATICPSGRNPDEAKFKLINGWEQKEDDMTPEQMKELKAHIDHQGQQRNEQHKTLGGLIRGQGLQRDQQHEAIRDLVKGSVSNLSPADLEQIAKAVADEQYRRQKE